MKQILRAAQDDGKRKADPRHHPLMVELDRMYRAYNHGLPLPNAGRVAKKLAEFLKANPGWPLERLRRAVWNRYASWNANPAEDPALWLKRLPSYTLDPLDKYGVPIEGEHREVEKRWAEKGGSEL